MDFVVFSKKKKKKKKEGLQPTNSDGFCGVLQRTNKKKIKDSLCNSQYRVSA